MMALTSRFVTTTPIWIFCMAGESHHPWQGVIPHCRVSQHSESHTRDTTRIRPTTIHPESPDQWRGRVTVLIELDIEAGTLVVFLFWFGSWICWGSLTSVVYCNIDVEKYLFLIFLFCSSHLNIFLELRCWGMIRVLLHWCRLHCHVHVVCYVCFCVLFQSH